MGAGGRHTKRTHGNLVQPTDWARNRKCTGNTLHYIYTIFSSFPFGCFRSNANVTSCFVARNIIMIVVVVDKKTTIIMKNKKQSAPSIEWWNWLNCHEINSENKIRLFSITDYFVLAAATATIHTGGTDYQQRHLHNHLIAACRCSDHIQQLQMEQQNPSTTKRPK